MDAILAFANEHNLAVVEDNAHGLTGTYKGKPLGSFGCLATQSFHETKNFSCGEGGALVINDPQYIERAEIIREKGTNRSRFFRGMVDKYTWVDIGSSYLPSDMLAAYLCAQLEQWQTIQARRRQIWEKYDAALRDWATHNDVRQPFIPSDRTQSYHMYYLLLPGLTQRQAFIARLKDQEILSVFHYLPLHFSDMGMRFGGKPGDCPVTERISDQLVRLPFFYNLTDEEQDRVIEAIISQPV
jgi:dTDP-4-amino-4,6-dideoxygalactose transaminase